jgi:hypothetical protein
LCAQLSLVENPPLHNTGSPPCQDLAHPLRPQQTASAKTLLFNHAEKKAHNNNKM